MSARSMYTEEDFKEIETRVLVMVSYRKGLPDYANGYKDGLNKIIDKAIAYGLGPDALKNMLDS